MYQTGTRAENLREYGETLLREEKSRATQEKYLRDVGRSPSLPCSS